MPKFKENPNPLKYGKKSSGFKMKSSPSKFMGHMTKQVIGGQPHVVGMRTKTQRPISTKTQTFRNKGL